MAELGIRIRIARMSACMTIRELASDLGICHSTLGHWETGRHAPPLRMLLRVADVTRADVHWILVGYGQSPKDTRDTSVGCEPLRDIDGDALDKVGGGLQLHSMQCSQFFCWGLFEVRSDSVLSYPSS